MSQTQLPESSSNARTLLVVEDDPAISKLVKVVLEQKGFRVTVFGDPLVALNFLERESRQFELALVDLSLPSLDGVEFARRLHEMQPELPLILTSGRGLDIERADRVLLNNPVYLPKPFTLGELVSKIDEASSARSPAR